jgi:hypothetical protein
VTQLLSTSLVRWISSFVHLEIHHRARHGVRVAISEADRSDLYTGLSKVLGPERAETLMSAIPLHDLDEVATKGDLALLAADLRTEMGDLRSEMGDLRSEMAELRAELKTDIAELRADMITEVGALRSSMANWMLTLLIAIVAAMAGIGFLS